MAAQYSHRRSPAQQKSNAAPELRRIWVFDFHRPDILNDGTQASAILPPTVPRITARRALRDEIGPQQKNLTISSHTPAGPGHPLAAGRPVFFVRCAER